MKYSIWRLKRNVSPLTQANHSILDISSVFEVKGVSARQHVFAVDATKLQIILWK